MGTTSKKTRAAPKRVAADRPVKEPAERFRLRLVASLAARVDALVPRFSRPWRKATRVDALRAAILRGLDALEAEGDAPPKSTGRRRTPR